MSARRKTSPSPSAGESSSLSAVPLVNSYVFDIYCKLFNGTKVTFFGKTITRVDTSKPGGWALIGDFVNAQSSTSAERAIYKHVYPSMPREVLVYCAKFSFPFTKTVYRSSFLVLPKGIAQYTTAIPANSLMYKLQNDIGYREDFDISVHGKQIATITASMNSDNHIVVCLVDYEQLSGKNSLAAIAEILSTPTNDKVVPYGIGNKGKNKKDIKPEGGLTPIRDGKSKKSENDEWKSRKVSTLFGANSEVLNLPDGVYTFATADGIILLCDEVDVPRMMHVLADYENVGDELRELMRKQADQLEALASAYRLVANMKKSYDHDNQ